MPDIIEKLRNFRMAGLSRDQDIPLEICVNAADEIERLRAAIRSFEHADTEMRQETNTVDLERACDRWIVKRHKLFLAAKTSSVIDPLLGEGK